MCHFGGSGEECRQRLVVCAWCREGECGNGVNGGHETQKAQTRQCYTQQ